jgi:hypothetical protein
MIRFAKWAVFGLLGSCTLLAGLSGAADPVAKPVAAPPRKQALLTPEDWQKTPLLPVKPDEIDRLIARELAELAAKNPQVAEFKNAPRTSDEQFLRRVTLDLTGKLPAPADVVHFVADTDPGKRAKLIDRLLDSDDYAAHWARYWGDVIGARVSPYMRRLAPLFEEWLFEQLKSNKSWGDMVRDMIAAEAVLSDTARGPATGPKTPINGAAFFVATRWSEKTRLEGAIDAAAETARVFLGIQLQCAQCHDDRSGGIWERVQFHQLAGFFGRAGGRPGKHPKYGGQGALDTWALVYYPDGEYEMPDAKDPKKAYTVHPAFLDGQGPAANLSDAQRRQALAGYLVDKNNFWFSAAYVNRIWYELLGQAFYQPIDDMGPLKEPVFPSVLARLTGAFRATDYDVKALFRTILNTEAYQRQFRMGETAEQHLYWTGTYPAQMRAPVLWQSLASALEITAPPPKAGTDGKQPSRFARRFGLEETVIKGFDFDPSLKPEGSLAQALLLMNAPFIASRTESHANTMLGRLLKDHADDTAAVQTLYLRTLARKPTDRELDKSRKYIAKVGKRSEAFEDLLWALINSPEFQIKR